MLTPTPWWSLAPLNVRLYGAKGDGVADDTASIQTALEDGNTLGCPIYFPGGSYLTSKLIYKGQSLLGDGQSLSIIIGRPGLDVFYVPDFSVGEAGSLARLPEFFRVENLQIRVDNSVGNSFSRPIYPVKEGWTSGHSYLAGEYVTGASGAVYVCKVGGVAGITQPSHTTGRASDGACVWLFVDTRQLNVANCAFVVPVRDGRKSAGKSLFTVFRNVIILGIGSGNAETGAFYSQLPTYACKFDKVRFRHTTFGFDVVPPSTNFAAVEFAPDTFSMNDCEFFCTYPYHVYNQTHTVHSNMAVYSSFVGQRGFFILEYASETRGGCGDVTFTNYYCEPNTETTGQLMLVMGSAIGFYNSTLMSAGGSAFIAWDADASSTYGTSISQGGGNCLRVFGDHNRFLDVLLHYADTAVVDQGIGNIIIQSRSTGAPIASERPLLRSSRTRTPAFTQDAQFIQIGHVSTPFDNGPDLLIGAREWDWKSSPTIKSIADPSLETGGYVRFTGAGSYAQAANGVGVAFGRRLPQSPCRIYVKARLGMPGIQKIVLSLCGTGGGTIRGEPIIWETMATDWAVYSTDCDFSSLPATQLLEVDVNSPPGVAPNDYVDIAWIAFRPVNTSILLPDPSGLSLCELFTDTSGLKIRFANGTTKLVVAK